MENLRFKNLSAIQVCHRMAAICQKSADQTVPGLEQQRLQLASNKFRDEADALALADLRQSVDWHINCSAAKTVDKSASSLDHRMKEGGLKIIKSPPDEHDPK